jgi:hypothetical protein
MADNSNSDLEGDEGLPVHEMESACRFCGGYLSRLGGDEPWRDLAGGSICRRVPADLVEQHHRPL